MRALVQRVANASVSLDDQVVSSIDSGILVFLGIAKGDGQAELDFVAKKVANLRIFADRAGKMNLSVQDVGGEVLIVSQFTLYGNTAKGNRPGFDRAMDPAPAQALYEAFCEAVESHGVGVRRGVFGGDMQIDLTNDGPVTLLIEKESTAHLG